MRATITGLPFDQDVSAIPSSNATVTLKVTKTTQDSEVLQAVPIWIPIVSAIGGIIIVSGLAYLLDRVNIFKMNPNMNRETVFTTLFFLVRILQEKRFKGIDGRVERSSGKRTTSGLGFTSNVNVIINGQNCYNCMFLYQDNYNTIHNWSTNS